MLPIATDRARLRTRRHAYRAAGRQRRHGHADPDARRVDDAAGRGAQAPTPATTASSSPASRSRSTRAARARASASSATTGASATAPRRRRHRQPHLRGLRRDDRHARDRLRRARPTTDTAKVDRARAQPRRDRHRSSPAASPSPAPTCSRSSPTGAASAPRPAATARRGSPAFPTAQHTLYAWAPRMRPGSATTTVTDGAGRGRRSRSPPARSRAPALDSQRHDQGGDRRRRHRPRRPRQPRVYSFEAHIAIKAPTLSLSAATCPRTASRLRRQRRLPELAARSAAAAPTSTRSFHGGVPLLQWLVIPAQRRVPEGVLRDLHGRAEPGLAGVHAARRHGRRSTSRPGSRSRRRRRRSRPASRCPTSRGGGDAATSWIVRGDTEGDYSRAPATPRMLKPIDLPGRARGAPREPLHVYGASAMKLVVDTDDRFTDRYPGHVRVGIRNVSPVTVNNAALRIPVEGAKGYVAAAAARSASGRRRASRRARRGSPTRRATPTTTSSSSPSPRATWTSRRASSRRPRATRRPTACRSRRTRRCSRRRGAEPDRAPARRLDRAQVGARAPARATRPTARRTARRSSARRRCRRSTRRRRARRATPFPRARPRRSCTARQAEGDRALDRHAATASCCTTRRPRSSTAAAAQPTVKIENREDVLRGQRRDADRLGV